MIKFIITILFSFIVFFLSLNTFGFAANRLFYENFDDQQIDSRMTVNGSDGASSSWTELSPPQFNLNATGRTGSGYCFSSGTVSEAYLYWGKNLPSPWPSDEMYVSFWMRYPTFQSTDSHENIKVFYPHWDGPNSYVHYAMSSSNLIYYSAKANGQMISVSNWLNCPNQTDGNWHHYEFYVKFSSGISRFWYDGVLKLDHTYGSGKWTNTMYYITAPSIDAEEAGVFSRQVDDWEVWDGMPNGGGDNPPSLNITIPTADNDYITGVNHVNLSGNASDDYEITSITWSNNKGGQGDATNNSGDWTSWSIADIPLQEGENTITVTATDSENQTSSDTLKVTLMSGDVTQSWSAVEQTGDSSWTDSTWTACLRLLIEGDSITYSGNKIMLGFKGRSSGDYTIKKVSIAERDANGGEGDVIDSTWTKVTFDGKPIATWASDVTTVSAGSEKTSDPIFIPFESGKDYYVTFLLESPSAYLIAPDGYKELYFEGVGLDHTDDVDWSENGHGIWNARMHAISRIYLINDGDGQSSTVLSVPIGLRVVQQ